MKNSALLFVFVGLMAGTACLQADTVKQPTRAEIQASFAKRAPMTVVNKEAAPADSGRARVEAAKQAAIAKKNRQAAAVTEDTTTPE